MTRIVWEPQNKSIVGTVGSLRYDIGEPDRTPGWRVWVHMNAGIASVGSQIVTMKAPDVEAAKYAAECHFRKFLAGLIGPSENAELLERALNAEDVLTKLRGYGVPTSEAGSGKPGTLLRFTNGKWFFLADDD